MAEELLELVKEMIADNGQESLVSLPKHPALHSVSLCVNAPPIQHLERKVLL